MENVIVSIKFLALMFLNLLSTQGLWNRLIPEVFAGYNCTIVAYGQTGTGKTYTMVGGSVFWLILYGFDNLHLILQKYTVRVSYLKFYNEELFDLLSDNFEGKGIRLFEDQHQKGSVIISGIIKQTVHNKHEVYKILQGGQESR